MFEAIMKSGVRKRKHLFKIWKLIPKNEWMRARLEEGLNERMNVWERERMKGKKESVLCWIENDSQNNDSMIVCSFCCGQAGLYNEDIFPQRLFAYFAFELSWHFWHKFSLLFRHHCCSPPTLLGVILHFNFQRSY